MYLYIECNQLSNRELLSLLRVVYMSLNIALNALIKDDRTLDMFKQAYQFLQGN